MLTNFQIEEELWRRGLLADEREAAMRFNGFAQRQLGINLHVGQLAFSGYVLAREGPGAHTAKYLTLWLASGNRAGKTSLLAAIIIYCCLAKTNLKPPDPEDAKAVQKWGKAEYHWYHFGISQEVADLVYNDILRMLNGTHKGQSDGCPLTRSGSIILTEPKEYGEYHWIRFLPDLGGAEVHFRTTGEKALSSLGKDMNGVSFDEAGLERNLPFLESEVFQFRRAGTGGQYMNVSTPSEDLGTAFADMWEEGNPENPDKKKSWYSMRMSARDNIGYGLEPEHYARLIADMDERTIRQNVDGEFLQAKASYFHGGNVEAVFRKGLPERSPAKRGMTYLQGVDPAKQKDSAWSITLAVVPNPADPDRPYLVGVRAEQKRGQKSTEAIVALATDAFNAYEVTRLKTRCYTATDATGFGGKMFRERLDEEIPNLYNVEFGGTVQKKRGLLGDLRTIIDEGRLILPREGIWLQVRKQLLAYKLEDRGIEQDAVMALVCAVSILRRAPANGQDSSEFDLTSGSTN